MKGLAAGVPLVCIPMGRDQNDTAARVVHAGAGVRLARGASAAVIAEAVQRVLREPGFRAAAARLQHAITTSEGCVDAVASLERLAATRATRQSAQGQGGTMATAAGAAGNMATG